MDIWQTIDEVFLVILGCFGLFVVCCMWVLCEEEVKGWWRRRKEKDE